MYIEDLILLLADKTVCPNCDMYLFSQRRDRKVLQNFKRQIQKNIGFTDKQLDLAIKIIMNRSDVFVKHNIDFITVQQTKLPVRSINRLYNGWIEDHNVVLEIPFDTAVVDVFRDRAGNLHTRRDYNFDLSNKQWHIKTSDKSLMDIYSLIYTNNKPINFDTELEIYMKQIGQILADKHNYCYASFDDLNNCVVTKNPYVLIDTDQTFEDQVNQAVNHGLEIGNCIKQQLQKQYNNYLVTVFSHRYIEIDSNEFSITNLVKLIDKVNITPVAFDVVSNTYDKIVNAVRRHCPHLQKNIVKVTDSNIFRISPGLVVTDAPCVGYRSTHKANTLESVATVQKIMYYNNNSILYDSMTRNIKSLGNNTNETDHTRL